VSRVSILVIALLVGAATPARAWCEATCLAPAAHSDSAKPHCPSHDSSSNGPVLSAAGAECPAIESARPIQAKLDFALSPIGATIRTAAPVHRGTHALRHRGTQAPRHPLNLPLRI